MQGYSVYCPYVFPVSYSKQGNFLLRYFPLQFLFNLLGRVLGHAVVDFNRFLNTREVMFSVSMRRTCPGDQRRILRQAVSAHSAFQGQKILMHEAISNSLRDLAQIDAHLSAKGGLLLNEGNIHGTIRVFEHLRWFRRRGAP